MKHFPHLFDDSTPGPRRPSVCFLFGIGNSRSDSTVTNATTTNTENNAYDNRIAATDNAVIVGPDGSFQVQSTTTTNTDSRDQSITVGDGMYVGPGGTLNMLDGGAIQLAKDAARIAEDAASAATAAAAKAAKDTTDALRQGYDGSLRTLKENSDAAFGFGRGVVEESLGFGERIAQSNESLADRAINAVMNTAKDAANSSGAVVNRALDSLLEADKSSEERTFQNITKMVQYVAIAAAVAVSLYALARYSK